MPAAAVIPALIAYFNVVAVKKLVVGFRIPAAGPPGWCRIGWWNFLFLTSTGYPTLLLSEWG